MNKDTIEKMKNLNVLDCIITKKYVVSAYRGHTCFECFMFKRNCSKIQEECFEIRMIGDENITQRIFTRERRKKEEINEID